MLVDLHAVIHRDLSSNNVLLSKGHLVVKISDLGTARMIRTDSKQTKSRLTTAPGTIVSILCPHIGSG